jgi:endoglucanase
LPRGGDIVNGATNGEEEKMRKDSLEFLRALIEAPSPSGYEQPAARVVRKRMRKIADDIRTDVHGNTICVLNKKGRVRVMLAGHCDQIGFMVKHINDQGFVFFAGIGGFDENIVAGHRVNIHTEKGPVAGVVGKKPIHLMDGEERKKVSEIKSLWIDIGARDRAEAEKTVRIGDPVTFELSMGRLLNDRLVAPGFDDKMGTFVVMEVMRLLKDERIDAALYCVATVQEEIGLRGAKTSAFGIDPHVGIACDVAFASDHPSVDKTQVGDIALDGGPVIARGANINPVVFDMLVKTARLKKIPSQISGAPRATGTDANFIQLSRAGVAAGLVGVPNRYMHTPVEIISIRDLENTAKLLAGFVKNVTAKTDFIPR